MLWEARFLGQDQTSWEERQEPLAEEELCASRLTKGVGSVPTPGKGPPAGTPDLQVALAFCLQLYYMSSAGPEGLCEGWSLGREWPQAAGMSEGLQDPETEQRRQVGKDPDSALGCCAPGLPEKWGSSLRRRGKVV